MLVVWEGCRIKKTSITDVVAMGRQRERRDQSVIYIYIYVTSGYISKTADDERRPAK